MAVIGTAQRGLGVLLLGVAAIAVGGFALASRDGIGNQFAMSIVELVGYLLVLGGGIAVVTGLVSAGLALMRR